ncbi:MAG: transglycosylase domain-containing protein [Algoriphagus sp.]|jgi:penicillin-binding protein 1A|uniref:penicillin-binding protein 1A n=2 Tax=Algoriphagus sp. TaxID=1872435 RepID=UPI00275027E8|nr:transglycosylase domain-containing protein [Algoriphagus sp.]MDP4747189.1 transglycosylase domain-containing protein [Algoriphagus sp.]MDP4838604.1 transglycosylase domain-containing protein [Algoriphagus sp.]MDP4904182.1 transglycosylase domain-containing protein [Algoriphagus sp.]MDP4957763.1 transglycosylase domain-containing protein [Algoriphagus sp.]
MFKSNPITQTNWASKVIHYLWIAFIGGLVFFVLFVWMVSINFLGFFGALPDFKALENPDSELASEMYAADGVLLGTFARENRSPVTYEELSPNLVQALIATEDERFEAHSGIDLQAMLRVFVKSILLGQDAGGGSTLSQQTAKNLFKTRTDAGAGFLSSIPGVRMLIIKTKEWIVATQLERAYTKNEILTLYLNTSEFGSNAFGIKTAAKTFFNKTPAELSIQESAVLVGLFKAPTYYSPVFNPENSLRRRNTVLYQMVKNEVLEEAAYDSISKIPIVLDYRVQNQNQGLATYFREIVKADLIKWTKENLKSDGSAYDLFGDGLKIYVTIDSRMQRYAEEAMQEHMASLQQAFYKEMGKRDPWIDENWQVIPGFIETAVKRTERYRILKDRYGNQPDSIQLKLNEKKKMKVFSWKGEQDTLMSTMDSLAYYKKFLQAGFLSMDPHTGHIKAWVGGMDHKYFKFDHVKQGKRQPGSTFKPFVYAAAIENGYSPCYSVVDQPVEVYIPDQPAWSPSNADGKFSYEKMTIRKAMAQSVNSVTAYMMKKLSPKLVIETARRLGITSELEEVPSLALGVNDVSIYEMVGAFGTFVNKGEHTTPYYIDRIEDKNGNVLQQFTPKKRPAMSEEHAYLMTYMLRGGFEEESGTSQGVPWTLREGNELGGKTGTTQNASDGWYMGISKDLVSGTWVGGDDRAIHFRSWIAGQGSRTARPIWVNYMAKVYADPSLGYTKGPFPRPERPLSIEIDCDKYEQESQQFADFDYDAKKNDF